jgi:hypothetical protein
VGEKRSSRGWQLLETLQERFQQSTTFFDVAFVALILALHKRREGLFLMFSKPTNGATIFKNNITIHTVELK